MPECQASITSNEFNEWAYALKVFDWELTSKQDYYLAQIATLLKLIGQMFAKSPKQFSIQDSVLNFKEENHTDLEERQKSLETWHFETEETEESYSSMTVGGTKEKWAAVNDAAKLLWARRLGTTIEALNNGSNKRA